MKKEKDLINFSQLWSFGPILMVVIIFFYDFSHLIGLGLGGKFAFISVPLLPTPRRHSQLPCSQETPFDALLADYFPPLVPC